MTNNEKVIKSMSRLSIYVSVMKPDNILAISHNGNKVCAEILASDEDFAIYAKVLVQYFPHVAEVLMVKLAEELQKFEMSKK